MTKAIDVVRTKLFKYQDEHKAFMVKNYQIRYRIQAWMNERLQEFKVRLAV